LKEVPVKEAKVDVVQELNDTFRNILDYVGKKHPENSPLYEPVAKYFELLGDGMARRQPMLWYYIGIVVPELFRAMDITAFSPEYTCAIMSSLRRINLRYLDLAKAKVPEHICSMSRFLIGLALSGDTRMPDMLIYAAVNPCDSGPAVYSNLAHYYNIPSFCLDVPYLADARAEEYISKQIQEMVLFLEEQTNRKLDWDRLRCAIDVSNQILDYSLKLDELRKNVPSPTTGRTLMATGVATLSLLGVPEMVDWCQKQYKLTRDKAAKKEGGVPEEKFRLIWISPTVVDFDLGISDWLESRYGAVTVSVLTSMAPPGQIDTGGSKSEIFKGLARRTMNLPIAKLGRESAEAYIRECIAIAGEYKADAAVFAGNVGCKYSWATIQAAKEALYSELGIPTLVFEVDPEDPRVVSSESVKAKFEQFFEVVF
jgi:benzoyl-CoA reductase/2-hydroxyglutaryl-CoA dehydratase subunit BcrC/BadD/HgdB